MNKINVKAAKGLAFWCQKKMVTDSKTISVAVNHDITCKLRDGSLVKVDKKQSKNS